MPPAGATPGTEDGKMNMRRMTYWWFMLVVSGRFLEKFLIVSSVKGS
jgi:hypothetical protein